MKRAAVLLAAVLAFGGLQACGSAGETSSNETSAVLTLVVDPNAGPGQTEENEYTFPNSGSGERRAAFVPEAAQDSDLSYEAESSEVRERPNPVSEPTPMPTAVPTAVPTAAPTAVPTTTPALTPTSTPEIVVTGDHPHHWISETIVDREAYDEQVLVKEAWDEEVVVTPAWEEVVVLEEARDESIVTYTCSLCGFTGGSEAEMEAHRAGTHADAENFGYAAAEQIVHHDAVTGTVIHEAEIATVHHDAEYETVHHDAVTHTIEWCSYCGILREYAD